MAAVLQLALVPSSTLFLVVDLQTGFRSAIHAFDNVVSTTNKMLRAAKIMDIPVIVTTQNAPKLGDTDPAVNLSSLDDLHKATIDKKLFSAFTTDLTSKLQPGLSDVVIMGIESHICVLQTALDCITHGLRAHVVADAVSSCNKEEVPLAFDRMRQSGVFVSSSESLMYQLMADAGNPNFRAFAQIVKDEKENAKKNLAVLLGQHKASL